MCKMVLFGKMSIIGKTTPDLFGVSVDEITPKRHCHFYYDLKKDKLSRQSGSGVLEKCVPPDRTSMVIWALKIKYVSVYHQNYFLLTDSGLKRTTIQGKSTVGTSQSLCPQQIFI